MSTSAVKLSLVVPCYQEAAGAQRLKREIAPVLDGLDIGAEVVAVDDGSTDGTGNALRRLALDWPALLVRSHPFNRGLGAALRTGIAAARGEWIAALDADMTFSPALLPAMLALQKASNADCVSGSPFLGGMSEVPLARRIPSMCLNAFYRGLLDGRLTSFTPMFRLYRAASLRDLSLESEGFEISVEILAKLLKAGATIVEMPAPLSARLSGESKLRRWRELSRHARLVLRLLSA